MLSHGFIRISIASRRLLTNTRHQILSSASYSSSAVVSAAFPPPKLFSYETITKHLTVGDAIDSVEAAFGKLASGKVDVPMPMHIGIEETDVAGPGDCHIKGGYISATPTFTVKLACVSFYNNVAKGLPAGSGLFCVVDAVTGAPLGIFQENRFMTDLRTGAAGAVALKYTTRNDDVPLTIGFIGAGAIARNMARAAMHVRPGYKGVVFGHEGSAEQFASDMSNELGLEFTAADTVHELCQQSDAIFTQTPGSQTVLTLSDLKPGTTIIASGSDQPTKQEIPNDVLASSKYIADLINQTSKVGELRGPIAAGVMTPTDVYCELGELVNGKVGRADNSELIVVDLTGTGAQDAAIGQVAWDKLKNIQ